MTLSIRTKLFLALVGTGALVALAMLATLRWSFERGLVELVQGREEARISAIAERLAEVYRRDGGWEGLRRDRRQWIQTLFDRPSDPQAQPDPPRRPPPRRRAWVAGCGAKASTGSARPGRPRARGRRPVPWRRMRSTPNPCPCPCASCSWMPTAAWSTADPASWPAPDATR